MSAASETFRQPDLAWSIGQIAKHGPSAFYEGTIAERLVADQEAHGGLITRDDLASYRALVQAPVRGTYRGYEIVSMPPPSSGCTHIVQILNMLEPYPIGFLGHNCSESIHLWSRR